jgi:serine/threonine protein kinase
MQQAEAVIPTRRSVPSLAVVSPNKIGPYLLGDIIGEGGFSVVRSALHESTRSRVACKIIPKRHLAMLGLDNALQRETEILRRLRHPAICAIYEVLSDTINCYVVMELCPQGSLGTRILNNTKLSEDSSKIVFRQLIEAVSYIHESGVAHRDLKPENILIDQNDRIKLIDFGLSNYLTQDGLFSTRAGSTPYAAPECFGRTPYDGVKFDCWSCGVVLYTMLTGQLPWTSPNDQKIIAQICKGEYYLPKSLSDPSRDLLSKILELDPQRRFSTADMLAHPWLAGVALPDQADPERTKTTPAMQARRIAPGKSMGLSETALMLIRKGKINRDRLVRRPARPGETADSSFDM